MKRLLLCVLLLFVTACSDHSSSAPTPTPMVCCSGTLTWEPNTEADLVGYRVYRSLTPNIPNPPLGAPLATVTSPTFTDTTGVEGTTYYYVVTAFDIATNESDISNEVNKLY